jgi:hypothetical protein
VAPRLTRLRSVLTERSRRAHTPLNADQWEQHLVESGLISRYPSLPSHIRSGFPLGSTRIEQTFAPSNHHSLKTHLEFFKKNVEHERSKGRWLGPFSRNEVEAVFGPFQTSPLSIIPKPAKPGAYRLIQNFSYPRSPQDGIASINAGLVVSDWPCSWGTFFVTALLISGLPEGSEGAVRDVSEAFRSCPIRAEDWPKIVVCTGDNQFDIDTALAFGAALGTGINGQIGDGSADIMRARGIGPIEVWVDDYKFMRILREKLAAYNEHRARICARIQHAGGRQVEGGRLWYPGGLLPDGRQEEFVEDHSFPILDLAGATPRSDHDAQFTYCKDDISAIASKLGLVFDPSKDVEFSKSVPYTGFLWDYEKRTVALLEKKRTVALLEKKRIKYLAAINAWLGSAKHSLRDAQSLQGKLIHASLVLPAGRAFLTGLAAFIGRFDSNGHYSLRYAPKHVECDLLWWRERLKIGLKPRRLPIPKAVLDIGAYSDASSGVGIAVWLDGGWWRAWWLKPGWNSKGSGRDIGWAEAVGFEFLVRILLVLDQRVRRLDNADVKVWGDNRGVVEGWWRGSSGNHATNEVFKRIHEHLEPSGLTVHTRYVRSAKNPADDPSRGVLGPRERLLPALELSGELCELLIDCTDQNGEPFTPSHTGNPAPKHITHEERRRRDAISERAQRADLDLVEVVRGREL